jgi:hypothetical protein
VNHPVHTACRERFEWVRGWPQKKEEESKPTWLMSRDLFTCYGIARGGGLEVFQHVREQGCEWDGETFTS